jgi:alpha-aminoadipate carrier protein LysW
LKKEEIEMMQSAECPQCGSEVSVGSQPRIGKLVECKSCGAELEVVWLDPLELDWPMMDDDEDYEDEIDEEDY